MSRDILYVQPHQDQWEVLTDNEQGDADMPRYDSKEEAIDAAILSAENSQKRGRVSQVLVKDAENGEYRVERTFE